MKRLKHMQTRKLGQVKRLLNHPAAAPLCSEVPFANSCQTWCCLSAALTAGEIIRVVRFGALGHQVRLRGVCVAKLSLHSQVSLKTKNGAQEVEKSTLQVHVPGKLPLLFSLTIHLAASLAVVIIDSIAENWRNAQMKTVRRHFVKK